jgi:undecaprenyl-diphosphatase
MIPAAAVGVLFANEIEVLFDRQIVLVGVMLWVTGILLIIADNAKTTTIGVSLRHSIIIGVAQAIAILPGHLTVRRYDFNVCATGY